MPSKRNLFFFKYSFLNVDLLISATFAIFKNTKIQGPLYTKAVNFSNIYLFCKACILPIIKVS